MKFDNSQAFNFENAMRGMRNPKNSWKMSDSTFGICDFGKRESYEADLNKVADAWVKFESPDIDIESKEYTSAICEKRRWFLCNGIIHICDNMAEYAFIGPKDMRLMQGLINGGSEHRKYLRQIFVSVDITAPLFW